MFLTKNDFDQMQNNGDFCMYFYACGLTTRELESFAITNDELKDYINFVDEFVEWMESIIIEPVVVFHGKHWVNVLVCLNITKSPTEFVFGLIKKKETMAQLKEKTITALGDFIEQKYTDICISEIIRMDRNNYRYSFHFNAMFTNEWFNALSSILNENKTNAIHEKAKQRDLISIKQVCSEIVLWMQKTRHVCFLRGINYVPIINVMAKHVIEALFINESYDVIKQKIAGDINVPIEVVNESLIHHSLWL